MFSFFYIVPKSAFQKVQVILLCLVLFSFFSIAFKSVLQKKSSQYLSMYHPVLFCSLNLKVHRRAQIIFLHIIFFAYYLHLFHSIQQIHSQGSGGFTLYQILFIFFSIISGRGYAPPSTHTPTLTHPLIHSYNFSLSMYFYLPFIPSFSCNILVTLFSLLFILLFRLFTNSQPLSFSFYLSFCSYLPFFPSIFFRSLSALFLFLCLFLPFTKSTTFPL